MLELRQQIQKIIIRGILCRDGRVLLLKSAGAGEYALPGGVMSSDETVEETFKKAMEKSIGCKKAKLGNFINMWSYACAKDNADCNFAVLDFEFSAPVSKIDLSDDYTEIKWISGSEIGSEAMAEGQKKSLEKYFARRSKK